MMYDVDITSCEGQEMHRTQIMLEEEQYQALRECARRSGKSMGSVVREVLDAALRYGTSNRAVPSDELDKLNGFFSDRDIAGRNHDEVLYGGA
jgi:hypothetical protein